MAKPTYKRSARIGDQMREEIADILMRRIKDPRIGFLTVTDVAVSDDLRNATVFVSVLGKDQDREASLKGLESAGSVIRSELGRRMRLKFVPELIFRYDDAMERGSHIMELLHDIERRDRKKGRGDE